MDYFEVLLLVLMALAGLMILAVVVGSSPASRTHQRHAAPGRRPEPPVRAVVVNSDSRPCTPSLDGDPRGQEVIQAE